MYDTEDDAIKGAQESNEGYKDILILKETIAPTMEENKVIDLSVSAKIIIELPRLGGYEYHMENIAGINISRLVYALEAIKFDLLKKEGKIND